MISLQSLNPKNHMLKGDCIRNLIRLCKAMAQVEHDYGKELVVTRAYSTTEEQSVIDPAHPKSAHCEGLAVDCLDEDKALWDYCIENLDFITTLNLYLEDKLYTKKHVHFQLKAPKSNNRIFIP